MTIPHVPFSMAGFRVSQPVVRPNADACVACFNKAGEIAVKVEQAKTLTAEKDALLEQITGLQAQVNAMPPTDREFADLRARVHLLARQEATLRAEHADLENRLQDVIRERESQRRTVENLHARLRRLGHTP